MDFLITIWDYVIPFLAILTVLVFVHELGHYWVARRNGVKVLVFSIGFGPEIFGWNDKAGTRWKVSALPLGGYVKMFGEYDFDDEDSDEARQEMNEEQKKFSFHHKRVGQRMAVVAAGPIANFLFAMLVFAGLFGTVGTPAPLAGVGTVVAESAAEQAGFQIGDRIVDIDGTPVKWFEDLRNYVGQRPGQPLVFKVQRGDETLFLNATPKPKVITADDGTERRIGLIGVGVDPGQVDYEPHDPLTAVWLGVEQTYTMTVQILEFVGQLVSGSANREDLGGPLRIAQISGEMAQSGFVNLFFFMAALSVNLGLINLFPIPVLDGGHLVFYIAEAVRGRPLNARAQEYGFRFGLLLVLLLMVFATWNDLMQFEIVKDFVN